MSDVSSSRSYARAGEKRERKRGRETTRARIYIYIYIYIKRERDAKRHRQKRRAQKDWKTISSSKKHARILSTSNGAPPPAPPAPPGMPPNPGGSSPAPAIFSLASSSSMLQNVRSIDTNFTHTCWGGGGGCALFCKVKRHKIQKRER